MSDSNIIERQKNSYTFTAPHGTVFAVEADGKRFIQLPRAKHPLGLDRNQIINQLTLIYPETHLNPPDLYNELSDLELFKLLETRLVGLNFGMTIQDLSRGMPEIEEELPGMTDRLLKSKGATIAFVGNALSVVPLDVARNNAVTIIDQINYKELDEDFRALKNKGFEAEMNRLNLLLSTKNIQFVQYLFGTGQLPKEQYGKYSLVINCFGPPANKASLPELLTMLSPGSELWISETPTELHNLDSAFSLNPLINNENVAVSSRIQRN